MLSSSSTPLIFSVFTMVMSGIIGPIVVVAFTQRMRRQERREVENRIAAEERHRSEVAAEAERVAREMIAQNRRLSEGTRAEIEKLALRTVASVKGMSNGNLLEAQRRELEANRLALATMREAVEMKNRLGVRVLPETYTAMDRMEAQIRALAAEISLKESQYGDDDDYDDSDH